MKKCKLLLILPFLFPLSVLNAQVTIGSELPPEKAAIIDLKTKDGGDGDVSSTNGGLLLPRIKLESLDNINVFTNLSVITNDSEKKRHAGLTVYNILTDFNKNIEEGIYVWSGSRWEKSTYRQRLNFFYMPSIVIPTSTQGPQPPIDLYQAYRDQFGSPKVKSLSAPASIPFFLKPDELYYYITDYDSSVFKDGTLRISDDGKFNYEVENASVDGTSYINIVFVIK